LPGGGKLRILGGIISGWKIENLCVFMGNDEIIYFIISLYCEKEFNNNKKLENYRKICIYEVKLRNEWYGRCLAFK
jgi:hypothetical protein